MKKIKRRLLLVVETLAVALSVIPALAQTNSAVSPTPMSVTENAVASVMTASNWLVIPFGIYDTGTKLFGGGVAVVYNLSSPTNAIRVGLMTRMDYINNEVWEPGANLKLGMPFRLNNGAVITPITFAGTAIAVSGKGSANGTLAGIVGLGADIDFPLFNRRWNFIFDVEKWTTGKKVQVRFSPIVLNF